MLFAVCAPGLENVLQAEIAALGVQGAAVAGGVEVADDGALARLNLWLRTATRVLQRVGSFRATRFPELVHKAAELPWDRFASGPIQFRVTCRKSRLYHSDAVAERLAAAAKAPRSEEGQLFVVRLDHDVCTVSADTSGDPLHMRGYRQEQGEAPLRETLAAALLLAARWDPATPLCDPMCGSGTIPIEAAMIAANQAPGLERSFAFEKWPKAARTPRDEARARIRAQPAPIEGSDQEPVQAARDNARRASVQVQFTQRRLADLPPVPPPGMIVSNPPYGVRLAAIWPQFQEALQRRKGWRVALIAPKDAPLRWRPLLTTQNGGIPVRFLAADADH